MGNIQASKPSPSCPKSVTIMVFISYGRLTKNGAKNEGIFVLARHSSPWQTREILYVIAFFFAAARDLLRSYEPLHRGKGCFSLANPRLPSCRLRLRSNEASSSPWRTTSLLRRCSFTLAKQCLRAKFYPLVF